VEMSSKIPVSRFRMVVPTKNKFKPRDPRFDELSGPFNEHLFKKSFSFLDELKNKEIEDLRKQLKREKEPEEQTKINKAISILTQRMAAEKRKEEHDSLRSTLRKTERNAIAKGKKPYYLKKSMERKQEMVEKFNQLKKENKLESFMAKRLAKNAKKDHRLLPKKRKKNAE